MTLLYLHRNLNEGPVLVMMCFYIAVLVLLLK